MQASPEKASVRDLAVECATARVLVIDDDQHFRVLTRGLLEPAGIELLEAADARQGLALIRTNGEIDAVIVDMLLPDEDGIQTLRRIKAMSPGLKVIAVSGARSSDFYLGLSAKLGADAVLPKSQVEALRALLESLLEPCR
ncbi:MAG: response regulator [Acidobacteriia bacterium]|nr:response regulator [Terriglobia bacterium]